MDTPKPEQPNTLEALRSIKSSTKQEKPDYTQEEKEEIRELKQKAKQAENEDDIDQALQLWQQIKEVVDQAKQREREQRKSKKEQEQVETSKETESCSLEQAYEIAREKGFSEEEIITHQDVNGAFDLEGTVHELRPEDIEIQSNPQELRDLLENAKERQEQEDIEFKITVRPNLTMEQMVDRVEDKFDQEGWGKPMYNPQQEEYFYSNELPNQTTKKDKAELSLITTKTIPGSKGKDYFEQAEKLIEFVKYENYSISQNYSLDQGKEAQLEDAFAELKKQEDNIKALLEKPEEEHPREEKENWKVAADKLATLKINRLLRSSAPELLSDMITNLDKTNGSERIFDNDDDGYAVYSWTNSQWYSSHFAYIGDFDSDGAHLADWKPHNTTNPHVATSLSIRV